ncbi:MAG TPA: peptide deformylase [Bacteroidetes bacterium]|nr:peptide deformylase [Bacteroidota bacterium]
MILPIYAYGEPVLRQEGKEISADYPKLKELIANMFETMYSSHGVGLAAQQIGLPIRLFVVDGTPFAEEDPQLDGFKRVFINAYIVDEEGDEWEFEEGCLSIPTIREKVKRHGTITLEYMDENFQLKEEKFNGLAARIIQHEHDHTDGVLFVDHINQFRRSLLAKKLNDISRGKVDADYRMRFPKKR